MRLPFTPEEFLDGFARFHAAAWPLHVVALAIAAAVVPLALLGGARASRAASLGLAALWLAAAALQAIGMRPVMPTAIPFAILFAVEAALFTAAGLAGRLEFGARRGGEVAIGFALVAYAAVVYPAIGVLAGEAWPRMPILGVAPCPNTIFTFGVLLLTKPAIPRWLLVIPALWSFVTISAAMSLGVPQDWGVPIAAAAAIPALAARDRRAPRGHRPAHA